jgi:hypothetical protein
MTPQVMVLGALAAKPGTVTEVQKRLAGLWPTADFPRNAAHTNLPRLAELGYALLLEPGEEPSQNYYEIAEAGTVYLREWVRRRPSDPANRDPILAKAQFATVGDLPEIVSMARDYHARCQEVSDDAQMKLLSDERLLVKLPPRNWQEEFEAELRKAALEAVTGSWGDLADRRQAYADAVDTIYEKFSARARLASEDG